MERRVFGPVPSRRLGKSLGVNNIPYKICTYSCIYCQVGKAIKMQIEREEFYDPDELLDEVKSILIKIQNTKEYPDYITIVPDGEPTLDRNLGTLISKLQTLKIPVAVITNGSLINLPEVQHDLLKADYPHKKLDLNEILSGIVTFRQKYRGRLVTETMLVKGINDSFNELHHTAKIIKTFNPDTAYLAIPTRPPAFKEVIPADEITVNEAYHIFREYIDDVELLTGYEGNAFASTGNFKDDLLSITAVHPMREDAVFQLMYKTDENEDVLDMLIGEKLLEKLQYDGHNYYLRKFKR